MRRCFGLRAAVVTALADNPVGRLIEDLMLQGGVDLSNSTIGYQTLVGFPFETNDAGMKSGQGLSFYVYPGYPQYSSLITLLNAVGSIRMPPDNPLPQADIQLISDWIQQGASPN